MFLLTKLRNNTVLTPKEDKRIKEYVDMYAATEDGAWLKDIPYNSFKLKWCHAMNLDNGVLGAFTSFVKNTVYLAPAEHPFILHGENVRLHTIVPTLIHELRHAWQRKKFGLFYIILTLPYIRQRALEASADKIYDKAERFFYNI